jgi:sulfur carrier protein
MEVFVNGNAKRIVDGTTIAGLLSELNVTQKHVAVEVNEQLVPRAKHAETLLKASDRLEVVTLVGGG